MTYWDYLTFRLYDFGISAVIMVILFPFVLWYLTRKERHRRRRK